MSFLARAARVKMLCVFHSFGLAPGDIEDMCFKKGFVERVKRDLKRIMKLLAGVVFGYDYLDLEVRAKAQINIERKEAKKKREQEKEQQQMKKTK